MRALAFGHQDRAVFHAGEPLFHTGWFVESLATQTLVLFVIRTAGNPFRSRPSPALAATVIGVVAAGIAIPFTPIGTALGFPVGMSAASDDPAKAAGRVSVVATIGYVAFLAGPSAIGWIGNHGNHGNECH